MQVTQKLTPQELAKDAADRYFAALTSEIPFDAAPGDVDLIGAATAIMDAIVDRDGTAKLGWEMGSALNAGYLLGIEIGKRIGGAR
jgi:hypothetical protein